LPVSWSRSGENFRGASRGESGWPVWGIINEEWMSEVRTEEVVIVGAGEFPAIVSRSPS
jgi:hypothetical protein